MPRPALDRAAARLDGALGRLVYRAVGAVLLVPTAGAAAGAWGAVRAGEWAGAAVLGAAALAFGLAVAYCFGRRRRLTDLE